MPETCQYRIGSFTIALIPDLAEGEYTFYKRFPDFRASGPPDIRLQVHFDQIPAAPSGKLVFDGEKGWRLYSNQGQPILWICAADQDPYLVGMFDAGFRSGEVYTRRNPLEPERYTFPLGYPLGELFMMNLLGGGYGVFLHGCGVVHQGKGLLFSGFGGAGKTTIARLWGSRPETWVLNDDRLIVRKINGEYRLYGTPWHGEGGMSLPEDAPLKTIFLLKQASDNQSRRLNSPEAASGLLARSFSPFWDLEKMQFVTQFLAGMCQDLPCYELGFLPDQSAVDFVLKL